MCDKMITATTYGAGRAVLGKALRERLDFKTGGALRGTCHTRIHDVPPLGRLAGGERENFIQDAQMMGITYIVWSYDTPIAWVRTGGYVHRVEQKFSLTTSKHQGMLYMMG